MQKVVGVFGGSGLYKLDIVKNLKEVAVQTPYGNPSQTPMVGEVGDIKVVFIPRHGVGHRINPSEINYRANVYAMKKLGVTHLLSISAVGSMKEEIHPGHMVVVDQFIDRTNAARPSTFFTDGMVAHVSFSDPVCPHMFKALGESCKASGATYHQGGTYICMEGPQFSTRAESKMYRGWGVSVIGMTNVPESKLAREAEFCYGSLAMATDYDCWHESEEPVTSDMVVATLNRNIETSKKVFIEFLKRVPARECGCATALQSALVTDRSMIPGATKERLELFIGKYLK